MYMRLKILIAALLLFPLTQGCLDPDEYPPEPRIEFEDFQEVNQNKALLTISFRDGDGNVGLAKGDTTGDFAPGNRYYNNLFLEYYEKRNGQWVKRDLDPPFHYRVPPLDDENDDEESLEGDIQVTLEPYYYDPTSPYDTIKYSIQLADKALNESNVVETDPIVTSD